MGLGEALMEEQAFRRLPPRLSHALVHKFPSMLEYKSPTSLDMPEIFTDLIEHPDPHGPFGAKEVGQGPLLPIMPAVANAVYDAVGVRVDEIPVTPEKILRALQAKAAGKPARYGPGVVSRDRLARAAARAAAVGRRRRPRLERAGAPITAQGRRRHRSRQRGCDHDAPAGLPLSRAAHRRGGRGMARRESREHDAARRRHRSAAEHEAAAARRRRRSSACAASASFARDSQRRRPHASAPA